MQITEILLYSIPASVYIKQNLELQPNQKVVVNVNGNYELGLVKKQAEQEVETLSEFVRVATSEDLKTKCENCKKSRLMLGEIKEEAKKLNLDMKISRISLSLDKQKIYVNYTAEDRIDFRELIKILGNKYKARIEMRQIGNRDETKLVGAIGVCGRETCCKAFLNDFDKVSIKMAKNQDIALNPSRINGMCGRLLCCLKYEDEFYAEMQKKMPKVGHKVETPDGIGTVSLTDFLHETVSVTFVKDETTEIKVYPVEEIKPISKDKHG